LDRLDSLLPDLRPPPSSMAAARVVLERHLNEASEISACLGVEGGEVRLWREAFKG